MVLKLIAVLSIALFVSKAYSFDDCGEANGSTYFSACIASKFAGNSQSEINALYKKLLAEYKKKKMDIERESLVNSQNIWAKYKESACNLEQMIYGGINSVSYGRCISRITSARLLELKELAGEAE